MEHTIQWQSCRKSMPPRRGSSKRARKHDSLPTRSRGQCRCGRIIAIVTCDASECDYMAGVVVRCSCPLPSVWIGDAHRLRRIRRCAVGTWSASESPGMPACCKIELGSEFSYCIDSSVARLAQSTSPRPLHVKTIPCHRPDRTAAPRLQPCRRMGVQGQGLR